MCREDQPSALTAVSVDKFLQSFGVVPILLQEACAQGVEIDSTEVGASPPTAAAQEISAYFSLYQWTWLAYRIRKRSERSPWKYFFKCPPVPKDGPIEDRRICLPGVAVVKRVAS